MPPKKRGGDGNVRIPDYAHIITGPAATPPTKPYDNNPPEISSCYYTSSFVGGKKAVAKKKTSNKPKPSTTKK